MAQVEKFFGDVDNINLTAAVGESGVNLKDDVMAVQAMLKYGLEERPYFKKFSFPEPTGAMNRETAELIKEYQVYLRRRDKVSVSVDGVISRAVGEKAFGKRGLWTILCLNTHVMERQLLSGDVDDNHILMLCRKFPQLFKALDDVPVGTLGLSLASVVRRVLGSLNLALE